MNGHDWQFGDKPIEDDPREQMNRLAAFLDQSFNGADAQSHLLLKEDKRRWGFCMMVFPFGDPSRCSVTSNCAVGRKDVVKLLKKLIAKFEGHA